MSGFMVDFLLGIVVGKEEELRKYAGGKCCSK